MSGFLNTKSLLSGGFSCFGMCDGYGLILAMRVSQLPSTPRVALHVPSGVEARYCVSVQVWPMYSCANQMELPSTTAAP